MDIEAARVCSELEALQRFETLLAEVSADLISLPAGRVDQGIHNVLRKVCDQLALDGIAIWESQEPLWDSMVLAHLYRAMDGPEVPLRIRAADRFPWSLEEARAGRATVISSVNRDLPAHARAEIASYEYYGVKSEVGIPLASRHNEPLGLVSFFTVKAERRWSESTLRQLRLLAHILTHALIRKRADIALRQSKEQVAMATEAADVGLWALEAGSTRVWTGTRTLPLLGLPPADGIDLDEFLSHVHPEDRPLVHGAVERGLRSGEMQAVEYRVVRADGQVRWLASHGRRCVGQSDDVVRLAGTTTDITKRKLAGLELEREKALIEAVFDSVPGLIYLWSPDGQLLRWNRQHEELTGYTAEELRGLRVEAYFQGDSLARMRREWERVFTEGRGGGEFECTMKDGSTVPFLLTGVRVEIDGRPHLVGMGLDISDRRAAEVRLTEMTRQLQRATRTAALGELSGAIAHELRQPLAGILSTAQAGELMIRGNSCERSEMLELLGEIVADTKRADAVIRGLQDLYREQDPSCETLEVKALLEGALREAERDRLLTGVTLRTHLDALEPLTVRGSRVQLAQVVTNLLRNATQAISAVTDREGRVELGVTNSAGLVRIWVRDNGPGIDPTRLDSIFQPLVTCRSGGMGLGLAISRKIVEAHGGTTWAANLPEGGACVGFALPVLWSQEGDSDD